METQRIINGPQSCLQSQMYIRGKEAVKVRSGNGLDDGDSALWGSMCLLVGLTLSPPVKVASAL